MFTQVFKDASYPTSWGSNALDTAEAYPYAGVGYPATPINVLANQTSSNLLALHDSRVERSAGQPSISLSMQVQDYARFRPNAGGSNYNIYVTLGKVNWSVNANAVYANQQWILSPTSVVTVPVLTNSTDWPYWNIVCTEGQ
jgi:hypothetical protein